MTPRFVFHPGAVADVQEARDWYEAQHPGLGAEFAAVIDAAIERVGSNPELYPELAPGVRRCVLPRFPYGLFYRRRANTIDVLAVFHHRRDPRVWHGRAAV